MIGSRKSRQPARIVSVPKAPMYENGPLSSLVRDVRAPGKISGADTKANAKTVEEAADHLFGPCVALPDRLHSHRRLRCRSSSARRRGSSCHCRRRVYTSRRRKKWASSCSCHRRMLRVSQPVNPLALGGRPMVPTHSFRRIPARVDPRALGGCRGSTRSVVLRARTWRHYPSNGDETVSPRATDS
jgi:hypothetical protein